MKRVHWLLLCMVVLLPFTTYSSGESAVLDLPAIFSNNMVIQRDKSIHIWGQANPNETIRVEFAGQSAVTVAHDEEWEVWLEPLPAGGPYELNVYGANQQRCIQNVMVGDVWIASGQSNMVLALQNVTSGADVLSRTQWQEANKLANSQIRLFKPTVVQGNHPLTDYSSYGWKMGSVGEASSFSAAAFFFGGYLRQSIGVPIGLVQLAKGSTPAQTWMSLAAFQASEKLRQIQATTETLETDVYNKPSALYNGLIAPLHKFPVKGVIWYQGESNAGKHNPADYGALMTALINDWRGKWHDQLPFITVQLTGYGVNNSSWSVIREEQRKVAQANDKVGLAVTIDVGERSNIHPINKMAVGYRLALQARCLVYGEDITCSGPTFQRAEIEGDEVFLAFKDIGSGLTSNGKQLTGFVLCDESGKCATAEATIENQEVLLWSSDITTPATVRYAWSDFPDASLFNLEGLPAGPFIADIEPAHAPASIADMPEVTVLQYPTAPTSRKTPQVVAGEVPIAVKGLQPGAQLDVTLQPVSVVSKAATPIQVYSGSAPFSDLMFNTLKVSDGAYDLVVTTSEKNGTNATQTIRLVICNSTSLANYLPYMLGSGGVPELPRIVVQGRKIGHLRLVSPQPNTRVAGEVPIMYQGLDNLVIQNVEVTLAPIPLENANHKMQLYSGNLLPDHLSLETAPLEDGPYNLTFSVLTVDGKTTSIERRIAIDNWTPLEDFVEAPLVNGWFGTVNRMHTEAATNGWEYVGDNNDTLFGDSSRIRRKAGTEESLLWKLPGLRRFTFTVYARSSEPASSIRITVSPDMDKWTAVAYNTRVLEQTDSGWSKVQIEGEVPTGVKAEHIRFTLSGNSVIPSDLQLGYVLLLGTSDVVVQ